jgi:hypothetical protein
VESRQSRREENQRLFRSGNERLTEALGDKVPPGAAVPFLCECADEFCDGRVVLGLSDWKTLASEPHQFVTLPGHPRSDGEVVVGTVDGYDVVRKPG